MKFDIVLMNPPYYRSTHLKFLEKVIKISDNVISIQPTRWLEDKVGIYKKNSAYNKYKESIAKYIKDLEIITAEEAEKKFDAAFNFNVGIYLCDKNGGYDIDKLTSNDIVNKVFEKMDDNINDHIEFSEPKNSIVVSLITGGNNGRNKVIDLYFQNSDYDRYIYDADGKRLDNGLTFKQNREKTAWGNVKVRGEQTNIKFNNVDECINFFNYTRTYLFRYIFNQITSDVHVQAKFLPFMKDYSRPWTNKRLYSYFNITNKEQKRIEEYIDKIEADIWVKVKEEEKNKKHKRKNNKRS